MDETAAWDGLPENPERDGWHWVHLTGMANPSPAWWCSKPKEWIADAWSMTPSYMAKNARYVAPCHTPAEVAALVEQARREEREAIAAWHDAQAAQAQSFADKRLSEQDREAWQGCADQHRDDAAAIRARSAT